MPDRIQNPKSKIQNRNGFTLTEVVLSVAIVAVAVVGVMTAFPVGLRAAREAREDTTLTMIAADAFARLRAQPFNSVFLPAVSSPSGGPTAQRVILSARPTGWGYTGVANMFYYSINGLPANQLSMPSKLGCPPDASDPPAADEGYFGLRVYFITDPYAGYGGSPSDLKCFGTNLTKVILDFSWPARSSISPDRRTHKYFTSFLANLN